MTEYYYAKPTTTELYYPPWIARQYKLDMRKLRKLQDCVINLCRGTEGVGIVFQVLAIFRIPASEYSGSAITI
jgi:hypothetical protein